MLDIPSHGYPLLHQTQYHHTLGKRQTLHVLFLNEDFHCDGSTGTLIY